MLNWLMDISYNSQIKLFFLLSVTTRLWRWITQHLMQLFHEFFQYFYQDSYEINLVKCKIQNKSVPFWAKYLYLIYNKIITGKEGRGRVRWVRDVVCVGRGRVRGYSFHFWYERRMVFTQTCKQQQLKFRCG